MWRHSWNWKNLGESLFTLETWKYVPKRPKKGENTCQGLNGQLHKLILFTLQSLETNFQISLKLHKVRGSDVSSMLIGQSLCSTNHRTGQNCSDISSKNKQSCDWSICKEEGGVEHSRKADTSIFFSLRFVGLKRRFENPYNK